MGWKKREALQRGLWRLQRPVRVTGRNFFGRKTEIVFEPHDGITWAMIEGAGKETPIDPLMALTHHQQLTLRSPAGATCHIYEHVGALRHTFVGLKFAAKGGHPPYFGGSQELFDALWAESAKDSPRSLPTYTVSGPIRWEYPRTRGGGRLSYVELRPRSDDQLRLDVTVDFPGVGMLQRAFAFPDAAVLREVCGGLPAGYPRWRYGIARTVARFGWPHAQRIAWLQELGPERFLETVLRHRALDLLGALSLLSGNGRFVGSVASVCAGHEADMQVVGRAFQRLYRLA